MIVMEGLMLVPPERGTIIGRAIWKPRYVVFGTGAPMKSQNEIMAEGKSSAARKALKSTSSKPSLVDVSQMGSEEGLFMSIYKAKGDWEFLSQHALTAFKSCEIRALAHRKQGPSLPTLMLEFKPDATSDKARKRRSSRTGGLTSKDPWANILLFRTLPDERHNIYDWQAMMKPHLTMESADHSPLTPSAPFNNFSNPFASRERRPDMQSRTSGNVSSYPHAPRERPTAIISPSPSLRSRRSDLSSQASSHHPPLGFTNSHSQSYTTTLPSDLPSPASTSYEPQFTEGWTPAQGRSSALSSHTRGSNSIASAVAPPALIASTPPGPRETILDRAFQMRCIPGSERISENDEDDQLSSMARFEALMREVDAKKLQRQGSEQEARKKSLSEWNIDEDSDESDSAEPTIGNDDDSDEVEGLELSDDDDRGIPKKAQVAISQFSGRRTPIPGRRPLSPAPSSPPVPFINPQAMSALSGLSSQTTNGLRPRTGTNNSTHQEDRFSRFIPTRSISAATVPIARDLSVSTNTSSNNLKVTDGKEKRHSSTSVKRLSFTEFARRLSSTSSLLLVQSNVSSNSGRSGRTSIEVTNDALKSSSKIGNESCGWRGSTGVFGGEGGFL